jgi:glycosyltransferase involved in cell wall biosynthesis
MSALVSIIIPTFNGEKYIQETVSHALNQTYKEIEVIVTDDCSTDQTLVLIKSNFPTISKILTSDYNRGLVGNINKGLSVSSGEFVLFLGQDDLLPPDHVQKMVNEFNTSSIVLVHCNSLLIDSNGKQIRLARTDLNQLKCTQNPLEALCKSNFIQSCGLLIRRSALVSLGGWDEKYKFYGEWLSYIRLAQHGTFKYCSNTLTYYRKHPQSLIRKLNKDHKKDLCDYKKRCRFLALHSSNMTFFQKFLIWFQIQFENMKDKYR